jgi:hypothetical protein
MRAAGAASWMNDDPFFKALKEGMDNMTDKERIAQLSDMTERALNAANTVRHDKRTEG